MDMTAAEALGYRPVGDFGTLATATCRATIQAASDDWRAAFPVLAGYGYDVFDYAAEDETLASNISEQ